MEIRVNTDRGTSGGKGEHRGTGGGKGEHTAGQVEVRVNTQRDRQVGVRVNTQRDRQVEVIRVNTQTDRGTEGGKDEQTDQFNDSLLSPRGQFRQL